MSYSPFTRIILSVLLFWIVSLSWAFRILPKNSIRSHNYHPISWLKVQFNEVDSIAPVIAQPILSNPNLTEFVSNINQTLVPNAISTSHVANMTIPTELIKSNSSGLLNAYFDAILKGYNNVVSLLSKLSLLSSLSSSLSLSSSSSSLSSSSQRKIITKIAIIGAGIAGLSTALELLRNGIKDFVVIESDSDVGGRVQSDLVDGFILDRGFQVFIEQYPEAQSLFNYADLKLNSFLPGALVRYDGKFHTVSDPFRRPQDLISSLISPIGQITDKIKVGFFSVLVKFVSIRSIFVTKEKTTLEFLREDWGLSDSMIDRFFKPFYQGIFLSAIDKQSARMFNFVFKMFTEGSASLPSKGLGEVTKQLASSLPLGSLYLSTRISSIDPNGKKVRGTRIIDSKRKLAETIEFICDKTVIATDPRSYKSLLETISSSSSTRPIRSSIKTVENTINITGNSFNTSNTGNNLNTTKNVNNSDRIGIDSSIPEARSSICLYYAIDGPPPIQDPILILNGENDLSKVNDSFPVVINNVCFPSQVSPSYAPSGKSLASVTVVGRVKESDEELENLVRKQLVEWFGSESNVSSWKFLRIYRIAYAQPAQTPFTPLAATSSKTSTIAPNIYCCGDHRDTATLNGAINSGKRAALAIVADLNS